MPTIDYQTIMPTWACLAPDGTIVVELLTDDDDEPITAMIPPYGETIRLARADWTRPIDLDEDGDAANLRLRAIVTEFVCRAEMRRNELALADAGR